MLGLSVAVTSLTGIGCTFRWMAVVWCITPMSLITLYHTVAAQWVLHFTQLKVLTPLNTHFRVYALDATRDLHLLLLFWINNTVLMYWVLMLQLWVVDFFSEIKSWLAVIALTLNSVPVFVWTNKMHFIKNNNNNFLKIYIYASVKFEKMGWGRCCIYITMYKTTYIKIKKSIWVQYANVNYKYTV